MRLNLAIHAGQVQCPERGPTDVAVCTSCAAFSRVKGHRGGQSVVCNPSRAATPLPSLIDLLRR